MSLLEIRRLSVDYPQKNRRVLHALSDVSLSVEARETMAVVGESGCGKSTLGKAAIRLIEPTVGEVFFDGQNITQMRPAEFARVRRRMQMIFQDPYASLNPRMKVRDLIAEPLETYRICPTRQATTERVAELLEAVGLSASHLSRYPHQFSGGQRQRVGIARAIALRPDCIVCDEPVSALDVSVQNQILNLLRDLQQRFGLTYLFISHDLSVVRFISDRVCVMFLGTMCEIGDTETIYTRPLHPYTRFLLDAIPDPNPHTRGRARMLLTGEMPSSIDLPKGCRFHTRCPYATDVCRQTEPELREMDGRMVACHHCGESL